MTLLEALTATREEDGKVADWAESISGKYKFYEGAGMLMKQCSDLFSKEPYWNCYTPCFHDLTRTDFTPHWETPAPMVPKPGEVWALPSRSNVWITERLPNESIGAHIIYSDGSYCELSRLLPYVDSWRLVYSPDEERMRRAQSEIAHK